MLTEEQQKAVTEICKAALVGEREEGVPAEFSAAQAIYESAYLTRAPGNNCFGVKKDGYGNGSMYTVTHEFLYGKWVEEPQAFETYETLADCFKDHARLIKQGPYLSAWLQFVKDANRPDYMVAVSKIYATDPGYGAEMITEAHSKTVQEALKALTDPPNDEATT